MFSSSDSDLRSYYEEEARQELRGPLQGRRVEARTAFIARLHGEGRSTVVDFGAGPGRDLAAFQDAGVECVGVDLAHGNGVLAAQAGTVVLQASMADPPFRAGAFDAGWSMSTLMHLPTSRVVGAIQAMARCLAPGALFSVGQWGGELGEVISEEIVGERRLFSLRTFDENHALLGSAGTVQLAETWEAGPPGWEYHFIILRVGG